MTYFLIKTCQKNAGSGGRDWELARPQAEFFAGGPPSG